MKILISDFDNTFYTLEYEANIKKVKEFVALGNQFIIATGRNLKCLLDDIASYHIPVSYYICNDGASIYDQNFKLIYQKNLNPDIVEPIFKKLDESFFTEVWVDHESEFTLDTNVSANKIIARPKNRRICEAVFEKLKKQYPITGYFSMNWINIMDESVDKGNAVEILEHQNSFRKEDIYTIGDSVNDIGMITKYKGAIMEKSDEKLKETIGLVVPNIRIFIDKINENF